MQSLIDLWNLDIANMLRLKPLRPSFETDHPEVYIRAAGPGYVPKTYFGYCKHCRVSMELAFGTCTVCLRPLSRL